MYELLPSFILGFHGCDKAVAESIFAGTLALNPSRNDYDWLGHGIYFWENNPQRGLDYAIELQQRPRKLAAKITTPAVIGAVIDLGPCLNLLDAKALRLVADAYTQLAALTREAGKPLPENRRIGNSTNLLLRPLDCAVIELLHQMREEDHLPAFHSVRGVFVEGQPLYPNSGFHERNHIQVCVRNPRCIKGYFRVIDDPTAKGSRANK